MSQRKRAPARRQTVTVKAHTRVLSAPKRRARNAGSITTSPPDWLLRLPWLREAGVPVTAETATQVSAVYGCCRLIVDSLAAAPIRVYGIEADGKRRVLHDDPTGYVLNWSASLSQAPDAPTSQAIEEALLWSALLYGNGYAEIQRDRAGRFFALWPIEPDRVTPRREILTDADGQERHHFYYEIQQATGGTGRLEPRDMFHLRGPSLYGWVGDSTVFRAAKAIGIAQAAQVFGAAYFANGTVLSGVLSSDKIVTQDQADQARASWKKLHEGVTEQHGIAVLPQGLKYESVGHDAQKSQLVEARRFQVQEIARFFGVPTTLLADNEAWTNLSELYLGFYRNALLPWAGRFDAEATRKLFPERNPWREVGHDLTELTMGKFAEKVSALSAAVSGGLKTRNEARAMLGDNTIGPEGDAFLVPNTVKTAAALAAETRFAALKAMPEVYAYHLEQGITTKNEVRARLDLPPVPGGEEFTEPVQVKVDEHSAEIAEEAAGSAPGDANEDEKEGEESDPLKPLMPMPPKRRAAADVARVAIALDRFERSLSGRRKAIERDAPEKADANVAEYRAKLEPGLVAECIALLGDNAPGMDMRVKTIADAVLSGEPPHLAAERLCT